MIISELNEIQSNKEWNFKQNCISTLPREILYKILEYLTPGDLCSMECVCVDWRNLAKSSFNYIWWKMCMIEWWEKDSRPKGMNKNDGKQEWKSVYSQITPHNAKKDTKISRSKKQERNIIITNSNWNNPISIEDESDEPTVSSSTIYKQEMRKYYKYHRAKPKGKRPPHGNKMNRVLEDEY